MAGMIFDLEICYESLDTVDHVRADQRDMVAFELKQWSGRRYGTTRALDEMTVTFLRFIGWHAMRRTGRLEPSSKFEEWERDVTSVSEPEAEEPDDEDEDEGEAEEANPTNPAPF